MCGKQAKYSNQLSLQHVKPMDMQCSQATERKLVARRNTNFSQER